MDKIDRIVKLVLEKTNKQTISKELKYHIDNNIPISKNVFRWGSEKFFDVIKEARELHKKGLYNNEDDAFILETDIGDFGKYNGKYYPLDLPMVMEAEDELEYDAEDHIDYKPYDYLLGAVIDDWGVESDLYYALSDLLTSEGYRFLDIVRVLKYFDVYEDYVGLLGLNEAKYKDRKVKLNKPKRGGSKKYYVYTKNPKTGNVIKVEYGAKGGGQDLRVKIDDPEARKRFASRHKCSEKKDKTKAGYWACRLPKDAKTLGLGEKINAYW